MTTHEGKRAPRKYAGGGRRGAGLRGRAKVYECCRSLEATWSYAMGVAYVGIHQGQRNCTPGHVQHAADNTQTAMPDMPPVCAHHDVGIAAVCSTQRGVPDCTGVSSGWPHCNPDMQA